MLHATLPDVTDELSLDDDEWIAVFDPEFAGIGGGGITPAVDAVTTRSISHAAAVLRSRR